MVKQCAYHALGFNVWAFFELFRANIVKGIKSQKHHTCETEMKNSRFNYHLLSNRLKASFALT